MSVNEVAYKNVVVVGAGLLGHAIGLVHALGGCHVVLNDVSDEVCERAMRHVRATAEVLVSSGFLDVGDAEAAIAKMSTQADLRSALSGADLVIEAISEDTEAKRQVFQDIDRWAPADAILASNTSYLDVFPLIPESRLPRSLIVHWYTPPYIVDLVDIVGSPIADPDVVATMKSFLIGLGKKPVVFKKFINGYVANRLQAAISLEVYALLDEGYVDPEDIDTSIKYGLAERMLFLGHLMKCDYSGVALTQKSLANKVYHPPQVRGRAEVIDGLVAAGRIGIMAGAGFYDYQGRSPEDLLAERDRKLISLKKALREIGTDINHGGTA